MACVTGSSIFDLLNNTVEVTLVKGLDFVVLKRGKCTELLFSVDSSQTGGYCTIILDVDNRSNKKLAVYLSSTNISGLLSQSHLQYTNTEDVRFVYTGGCKYVDRVVNGLYAFSKSLRLVESFKQYIHEIYEFEYPKDASLDDCLKIFLAGHSRKFLNRVFTDVEIGDTEVSKVSEIMASRGTRIFAYCCGSPMLYLIDGVDGLLDELLCYLWGITPGSDAIKELGL